MRSPPSNNPDQLVPSDSNLPEFDRRQRLIYRTTLFALRESQPFSAEVIGLTNPYTNLMIENSEQYDEYLRQRALSLVYQRIFSNLQASHDQTVNELSSTIENDRRSLATLNSQIRQNEIAAKKKIRIRSTIITLLVVSLLLGAAFIPDIKKNSFNEGFAKGELLSEQAY